MSFFSDDSNSNLNDEPTLNNEKKSESEDNQETKNGRVIWFSECVFSTCVYKYDLFFYRKHATEWEYHQCRCIWFQSSS